MKRSFKLQDLDCANCASKMECDINKLTGVNSASINFMTSKLTLDADDASFSEVLSQAQAICTKYEPDCTIVR
ncbi:MULTISPECIES: cation transporter [unclassified Adlercreutzia]|uniref:cation transporter n=1 Tax=unclassified Adlercreutzia TaxID=2636013 RepID=UPI0013EC786C|nr:MULTISPECIES: cation transporter [unclassified Adlercreutzia]